MKNIHVVLEDGDYRAIMRAKGKLHWREFLLKLVPSKERKENVQKGKQK